jgi:hypothetical protein
MFRHVCVCVCDYQGALLCLMSYTRIECMVDKTALYVCYVEAWCALICLVMLPSVFALGKITMTPHNRHITTHNAVLSTIKFNSRVTQQTQSSLMMTPVHLSKHVGAAE